MYSYCTPWRMINIHVTFKYSSLPLWPSPSSLRPLSPSDSVSLYVSFPLCVPLFRSLFSPCSPVGWMVCSLARCSSWCPRRSLTWGEHRRRVKLTFYFITHIETPAVLNVIQRVNAAQPGGNNKNINSTITTQEGPYSFTSLIPEAKLVFI